jgi:hypothetical protein
MLADLATPMAAGAGAGREDVLATSLESRNGLLCAIGNRDTRGSGLLSGEGMRVLRLRKGLLDARLMLMPLGGDWRPVVVVDMGLKAAAGRKTDENAVIR